MDDGKLLARLERLEAVEAIRRLKALYCRYCDEGYDPARLGPLFCEDAVWDAGAHRGVFEGRAAIETFFGGISDRIPWAAHVVANDLIDVDGDTGRGEWRMIMPCNLADAGKVRPALQIARYVEDYRRVDGRWLFARIEVRLRRLELGAAGFEPP